MEHQMSPTATAVLILMAIAVDYISIGPDWLRDRIAFTMYVAGIYEGFNGSKLDMWTTESLRSLIEWALTQADGAYIAGASAKALVGVLVFVVWLYGFACMLPQKASKKLGRFATLAFPGSAPWSINWRLLGVAIALALLGDVPFGWVGELTEGTNTFLAGLWAPFPGLLVGDV